MVYQTLYHFDDQIIEWQWSAEHALLKEPFWTSCFVIDGLLIDCAAPGSAEDFRNFLDGLEDEKKVEKCVVTHNHEDHCGCGYILQQEYNIPIYASAKAIPLLKAEKDLPDYRQMTWGEEYIPFDAQELGSQISTKSGKYTFEVFPMPGHAEELISLIERAQQWAFITDAVMPNYKMIFGQSTDIPENIAQIYHSIQKLYAYTEGMDHLKLINSGRGIFEGREFLVEKLNEIKDLHLQAHAYNNQGIRQGLKNRALLKFIIKKMFKKESFIGKFTRGDLSIKNLIISLLEWPLEE